ncbi:siderophore-interacting protein [Micromonospora sp. NPDC048930]|uniref:siderophore-interacting protein n=1 Tax=Micromonospora sp. NPDC048930 TaxID=3364261 RepID=UPI00371693D4
MRRFAEACKLGEVVALRAALDADAIAVCDGGERLPTAAGSIHGAQDVAQLVSVLLCGQPGTELTIEAVNGRAGLALRRGGQAIAVVAVQAAGTKITMLWIVLSPAKLCGWHHH